MAGLIFLWGMVGLSQELLAQTVSGTVVDETGAPMPGVNVFVPETGDGTITDVDGNFSIGVPDFETTVQFSFVGYKTVVVPLKGRSALDVQMEVQARMLEEAVVIGYGTVQKKDLTGAVSVVTSEELTKTPITTLGRALQGKASGVVVMQSGAPGGNYNIRVRGVGSINLDPDPLYVIDGIVGADINSVAPEDIESISVLKDASASAIYGANGANGVIVVTTKRGDTDKTRVSFSAFTGTNFSPKQFELMNADQYADFYNETYAINGEEPELAYTDEFRQWYYGDGWEEGTDWQNEILQDNMLQNYYLRISSGGEKASYSISANYYDEEGILLNTNTRRINLRANSDFTLGKFFKVGESLSLTRGKWRESNAGAWGMALESSPLMRVYNENNKEGFEGAQIPLAWDPDGDGVTDDLDGDGNPDIINNTGGNDKFNPKGELAIPRDLNYSDGLLASVYLDFSPVSCLTFTTTPSINAYISEVDDWTPAYEMGVRSSKSATLNRSYSKGNTLSLENKLVFNRSFGDHNINAVAVHHVRQGNYRNLNVDAAGFPYEQLNVVSQSDPVGRTAIGGKGEWSDLSYLGRVIYDYQSKYLLTASIRRDGSSNFSEAFKWGTFPSLSLGWKLNEDFLQNVEQINLLKLRFGWGKTGNADIGGFRYDTYLAEPIHFSPVFGVNQQEATALNELWTVGNPRVKWEAAEMTNFGFDLNTFGNRIQFSAEYYIKKQNDLFMEVPISQVHGKWYQVYPLLNIAKIENRGFEFDLRFSKMEGVFNYRAFANLSTVKNEVIEIPEKILDDNHITKTGHSIGSIYGWVAEGIVQESDFDEEGNYLLAVPSEGIPEPGDIKFRDLDKDGKITDRDRTIIGKGVPDISYSFGFELFYEGFDFSVFLYGITNAQIYNTLRRDIECFEVQDLDHNKSADWAQNYYTPERPTTEYIRADPNDINKNTRISTWWVENAAFLRLKDIQLGYNIPQSLLNVMRISRLRVYVSGVNLYTFTKYSGRDPESPLNTDEPRLPGVESNQYPVPRTFTAGIQIDF